MIVISAISIFTAAGTGFGQEPNIPEGARQKLKDTFKLKDKKSGEKPFIYSFNMPFGNQSRDVLVIPASEMGAEKIGEITEDMAVMSRILEKQLHEKNEQGPMFFYGASWLGRDSRNIFIEGYGVLFLMKVDFPLLPASEAPAEEVKKEEVDPTWEQAKRELHSTSITVTEGIITNIPNPRQFVGEETKKYDKEKVERLKAELIQTLKYAANIRALKSDEFAIAVITGAGQTGSCSGVAVSTEGKALVNITGPGKTQSCSSGVLTIRAKKSDIDAYSKGELSLEQFCQKIGVLIY
jgi:hypothetical protein